MKYKESSFFYVQSFLLENLGVIKVEYVIFIECLVTLVGAEDTGTTSHGSFLQSAKFSGVTEG